MSYKYNKKLKIFKYINKWDICHIFNHAMYQIITLNYNILLLKFFNLNFKIYINNGDCNLRIKKKGLSVEIYNFFI